MFRDLNRARALLVVASQLTIFHLRGNLNVVRNLEVELCI